MQGRKSTRASIPLLPRYRESTGFEYVEGQCLDISVGGMFIASSAPCSTGTLLKFECLVDGQTVPIRGVGRVVWQRQSSGERDRPSGMGLKFVKLEPGAAELIEGLIREAQLQGMTAPTHPLPASYTTTDSFPPAEGRLSSSTRMSVVNAVPVAAEEADKIVTESHRAPAGTTAAREASGTVVAGTSGVLTKPEAVIISASPAAVLPAGKSDPSDVPAKLRAAARWISLLLAAFILAWTFLR
jgi:Tfp pilus assembly protein PilZ